MISPGMVKLCSIVVLFLFIFLGIAQLYSTNEDIKNILKFFIFTGILLTTFSAMIMFLPKTEEK